MSADDSAVYLYDTNSSRIYIQKLCSSCIVNAQTAAMTLLKYLCSR